MTKGFLVLFVPLLFCDFPFLVGSQSHILYVIGEHLVMKGSEAKRTERYRNVYDLLVYNRPGLWQDLFSLVQALT